ncbi:serine/threonine protein kinase [Mesobacillus zeae]|uniref:Protein kinase family protein n=1 Tax=Mesobacillus zeae TaxID=1917180 RepID=A0A398BMH2_9BACI|nr:protein kinase [Mesobacillus zeae]RID88563.1 protein kinase family protein [Mesobacillus zeae]
MMNNPSKNQCNVKPGTVIHGKWHRNSYAVIKELGFGANGTVYLARATDGQVALKMSENPMSITSEVNVLKSFAKVQGSALGPSLLDVDDWEYPDGKISFYVMEFIKGPDLLSFLQKKGSDWLGVLMLQLLKDLQVLHSNGWVFGDLKPENLIVTGPPARIRCIDTGGTTVSGRAIKEFTEFFDRGYWGMGSRKADEQYDLFAVAMIIINAAYLKRFNRAEGGRAQLIKAVQASPLLKKYEKVIDRALTGRYISASDMRADLLAVLQPSKLAAPAPKKTVQQAPPPTRTSRSRQASVQKKKKGGMAETAVILAVISLIYFFYLYSQLV